jgi:hypothetical protein
MPTLSASDYTTFVKAQASALAYANGRVPNTIQTSSQPYPNQSVLNATLLASQASYVAATPGTVKTVLPVITAVSTNTVTAARTDILSAATADVVTAATGSSSAKTFTYTTSVSHGLVVGDLISITGLSAVTLTSVNVTNLAVTSVPSPTTFVIFVTAGAQDGTITTQSGRLNIGNLATPTAYYTSSVPHGLSVGTSVTISGFTTLGNVTSKTVTRVIDSTRFAIANNGIASGVGTGTGSITGLVYYTTSVPHGLVTGQTGITITDITTFTAATLTVANVGSTTNFALASSTPGTAVTGQTGRIAGFVYYTTAAGHLQTANIPFTTYMIVGLTTTPAFNISDFTITSVPDGTTFIVANAATGTAITGQSGYFERTTRRVPRTVILGNARIRPYDGMGPVNNPKSLSTVAQSGTLSSAKFQQRGGLPLTAPKGTNTYAPMPQLARVDTKATGAYPSVRQPV